MSNVLNHYQYLHQIPEPGFKEFKTSDYVAGKLQEAGIRYRQIVEELWQDERIPVVCACTELPVAYQQAGLPADMGISSLEALADGCIRELYKPL